MTQENVLKYNIIKKVVLLDFVASVRECGLKSL